MVAEFDPEELASRDTEFRRLWGQFQQAKRAQDELDGQVIFREPGQGYPSGRVVSTSERIAINQRREHALQELEDYCEKKGLPKPPF